MMRDLHVTEHASRIGFYSGLVVSIPIKKKTKKNVSINLTLL